MFFWSKFKKLRLKNNLTQKRLGKILNLSASTISNYENDIYNPSNKNLKKITLYFNVNNCFFYKNTTDLSRKTTIINS